MEHSQQQQLLERGKEIIAAHKQHSQPRQRTEEEHHRLLAKGRALLTARMQAKQLLSGGDTTTDALALAIEQHAIDAEKIESLEAEVAMTRKQLDAARSAEQLHTPLKVPPGTTVMSESEEPQSNNNGALQKLLEEQLAHVTELVDERAVQIRALEESRADAEAEALALCATIADLQAQVQQRDDQLAKAYETIDILQSSSRSPTDGADQDAASRGQGYRGGLITSPSATVSADQLMLHSLEEQVHQLSREKLEVEREAEGQREIITNLQTQWNSLVSEVQKREAILTDEVRSLQVKLADTTAASTPAAVGGEDALNAKLEEQRTALYAEFNQHIAKYQEVNNKHWADLVAKHADELKARDATILELRGEQQHGHDHSTPIVVEPTDQGGAAAEELHDLRTQLAAAQSQLDIARGEASAAQRTLEMEREAFNTTRAETDAVVAQLKDDIARLEQQSADHVRAVEEDAEKVAAMREELQQQLDAVRADFALKSEECLVIEARSAMAQEHLAESQAQLASAESLVAQLQDEVKELTTSAHDRSTSNAGTLRHDAPPAAIPAAVANGDDDTVPTFSATVVEQQNERERIVLEQRIAQLEEELSHTVRAERSAFEEKLLALSDERDALRREAEAAAERHLAALDAQQRSFDALEQKLTAELLAVREEEIPALMAAARDQQLHLMQHVETLRMELAELQEAQHAQGDSDTEGGNDRIQLAAAQTAQMQGDLDAARSALATSEATHQSAITVHQQQSAVAVDTIERLRNDADVLRAQVDDQEKQIETQHATIQRLEADIAVVTSAAGETQNHLEEARSTLRETQLQLAQAAAAQVAASQEVVGQEHDAQATQDELRQQLEREEARHQQRDAERLARHKQELDQIMKQHAEQLEQLRAQLLRDANATEQQYLDEIAALRDEHQDAMTRLQREQAAQLDALQQEASQSKAQLTALRSEMESTLANAQAQHAEQMQGALVVQAQSMQSRIDELDAELCEERKNKRLQLAQLQLNASESEKVAAITREISIVQSRLSETIAELHTARASSTSLQEDVKKYLGVVTQLEAELATKSRDIGMIRQESAGRAEQLEQLEGALEQLKQQLHISRQEKSSLSVQLQHITVDLENARVSMAEAQESSNRELNRVVALHSKELLSLEQSRGALEAQSREELQRLKEELAVANALLQQYLPIGSDVSVGGASSSTSAAPPQSRGLTEVQVQKLQSQLAEQTRQCQRLATQLQLAHDEIVDKSSIIRDQDISLSSLGENNDTHQSLQQLTERVEELEARVKRVTRERDGALMEKDLAAVDLTNINRKLDGKDQIVKRLEAELRAQKQNLQTQKQDNAVKLRQLSDLRQEVAQLQSQLGASQERLQDETQHRVDTMWVLQALETSVELYEEKMFATWALLTEELLVNGYAAPFMEAVAAFADRNARILKRCDDIDSLAQEALEDGLRQNRDLRDQCRAQQQRIKLIEDTFNEGEKRREELDAAYDKAMHECKRLGEELQSVRQQAATEESTLQREVVALKNAIAQTNARNERLTSEAAAARETFELEQRSSEESLTSLKATLKSRSEQLHALERDSTSAIDALTQQLHDCRRDHGDAQRVGKVLKGQIEDLTARLAVSEPAAGALTDEVAELKSTVLRLTKQREHEGLALRRSLEALEEQVGGLTSALDQSKLDGNTLTQENAKLTATLHTASEDVMRLRERLGHSESALTETTTTLEEERENWYRERRAAEQRIAALQSSSRVATTERDDAVAEASRLRASLEDLEKSKKSTESDHMITTADLHELQQAHKRKVFEFEHNMQRLDSEASEMRGELDRSRLLVEQLKDDKAKLRIQSELAEQHLREANGLNIAAHREVQALQHQLSETTERLEREMTQLRLDLATAKKVAAGSDARARDAERTCESLTNEKRQLQEEFERTRTSMVTDLQVANHEKQETHARATDLHRQGVALEAELAHVRRQVIEVQGQLGSSQQELSEYRALVHTTSERARAAVAEREELSGQLAALRDESRRQKVQLERRVKEAEDAHQDRAVELESLQARLQQGSQVLRTSEMGLQQHITDLTVAQHQLKHDNATLTANYDALKASLEQERAQTKKSIAEAAAARQRLSEVEQEHAVKKQQWEDAMGKQNIVVQQLTEDLESLRAHATDDKKSALASLERVIQADRQALADVRQARERALRACDQAQREKSDLEGEIERLTNTVRVTRLEAEAVRQELQSVLGIAEQAAGELGQLDDTMFAASPFRSGPGGLGATGVDSSHNSIGGTSASRPGDHSSIGRAGRGDRGAAKHNVGWFGSLMDKILSHLASVRGGANTVALERQQLRETHTELDVHERAIQDAAAAIESVQLTLRQLSDRVEIGRSGGQPSSQPQYSRSGSRLSDADGHPPHHTFGSRDSSHERHGVTTPRLGGGNTSSAAAVQHTRLQRFALTRLVQQSLLLEKCLQTSSVTQGAMRDHLQTAAEHLATLERAAMSATTMGSHYQQRSNSGPASAATSHHLVSASTALEMFASEPAHITDAIRNQCVVLGSGLCVISTRVAQQTRMLVSLQQQLREFQAAVDNPQISLETLLLSGGGTTAPSSGGNNNNNNSSAPPYPLIHNPREFALVFSQAESWSTLSFLAISAMAPVTMQTQPGAAATADVPYSAASAHHQTTSRPAAGANAPRRRGGGSSNVAQQHQRDEDDEDIDIEEDVQLGAASRGGPPHHMNYGDDVDDDSSNNDAAGDVAGEDADAKIRNTRTFQKMRRENKRLYVLVRNLTEKLKVASTQAGVTASSSRGPSLSATVGGGSLAATGNSEAAAPPAGTAVQSTSSPARGTYHYDPSVPFVSPIRRTTEDDRGSGGLVGDDDDDDDELEPNVVMRPAHNDDVATHYYQEYHQRRDEGSVSTRREESASTVVAMSPDGAGFSSPEADVRWVPR